MIPFLAPGARFPPVDRALARPDGLLAAGGDLSVATLVRAYRQGIFPWFNEGDPILWWAPNPRMVLRCAEFHVSRTLRRRLKRRDVRVSLDEAFVDSSPPARRPVTRKAAPGSSRTCRRPTARMHTEGLAHSVEVWRGDQLVGGLYGVALGRMFFGESMVSREPDVSKMAMAWLAAQLLDWDMPLIDCQMATPHLASLGARSVPRRQFTAWVAALASQPGSGRLALRQRPRPPHQAGRCFERAGDRPDRAPVTAARHPRCPAPQPRTTLTGMTLAPIGQISMTAHDITRATTFYRDTLGLRFLFSAGTMSFFDCQGVRLMLGLPSSPEYDHPGSVLYFTVTTSTPPMPRSWAAASSSRACPTWWRACPITSCGWPSSTTPRGIRSR